MDPLIFWEIRGSMTRFHSITPEWVLKCSNGSLTYSELADILSGYGLSVDYVVHDPERQFQSTYYADYENALYRSLFLTRDYLEGSGAWDLNEFSKIVKTGNPFLMKREWESLYTISIPMPMLIYDFQKRMRDIEPENVFKVWYGIYKRIDYANGMWTSEILEYVFSHAPETSKPDVGENGLVTIYRGMGAWSQTADTAISWSTHPGNAIWFANRFGRGTHLAIADVALDDIVAYYPSYYNENEVLVRPNTIRNIRFADMFPVEEETFVKLAVPALTEFQFFGQQTWKFGYKEESVFGFHGIKHVLRVLLLSLIYFYGSDTKLTDSDKGILIFFSLLHDVGRTHEDVDDEHGAASAEMIRKKNLRVKGLNLTAKEYRIADLIIRYHSRDDKEGLAAIQAQPGFSRKDKERAKQLYLVCKDMDGLDRVRFNGLDYRMLRTQFALRLPLIPGCLLEENILTALDKTNRYKGKEV
jgi:hypothetical protein